MKKVFIGGSRKLSRLTSTVTQALDALMAKEHTFIIGDANGADKAVQNYLFKKQYHNVIVYCMQDNCRNNLGNWTNKFISTGLKNKTFEYYATKDLAMAEESDCGLMLWDSESKGTLNNIKNLLQRNKQVIVYFSPKKCLYNLNSLNDLSKILKPAHLSKYNVNGSRAVLNTQGSLWGSELKVTENKVPYDSVTSNFLNESPK